MAPLHYEYVILGSGVAGAAAAETLRAGDRHARIALVGDEPLLMYYRPRLPGYVAGHVARESIVERGQTWADRRHVDTMLGVAAEGVDASARSVALSNGTSLRYGSLLLATGARPRRLGVAGEGLPGVHCLWSLADAEAILAGLPGARRAVTIGGGFIGAELTEALALRGLTVTYLCRGPWWFYPYMDATAGRMAADEFRAASIDVRYHRRVVRVIERNGRAAGVMTDQGEEIEADLVAYALGASWDLGFLEGSGVDTGRGVPTDAWLQTSEPHVWAAGAVASVANPIAGRRVNLHNVAGAQAQGRMAALGMLGRPQQLLRLPQYGFRLFGLPLLFVGVLDTTDPTLESVISDRSPHSYARIFQRDGRIAGALLVNSSAAGEVRRLIEQGASAPVDDAWFVGRLSR